LGGIEKSGWKLVYRDTLGIMHKSLEARDKVTDLRYSLGMLVGEDGTLLDVMPDRPAAKAGLSPTMKLVAVDGRKYSKNIIRDALKRGTNSTAPLQLLATNGEFYKTYAVDYHGGERYPHLERDPSVPDLLGNIIGPVGTK
jgi:predicted metalloprotease with PDZ domain